MQSDTPLIDNFRANLRKRINAATLSKTAIAARAGIHRVTLHKILAGQFEPSLEMCQRLAAALGVKPTEKIFARCR